MAIDMIQKKTHFGIFLRLFGHHDDQVEVVCAEGDVEQGVDVHAVQQEPQRFLTHAAKPTV